MDAVFALGDGADLLVIEATFLSQNVERDRLDSSDAPSAKRLHVRPAKIIGKVNGMTNFMDNGDYPRFRNVLKDTAIGVRDRSVTVSWRPTPDHTGEPWTQRVGLP